MMDVKYPDVEVRLVGTDGNALAVLGRVARALRRAGHADVVDEFMAEGTSGDYDNVLVTCMRWVDVSLCGARRCGRWSCLMGAISSWIACARGLRLRRVGWRKSTMEPRGRP